MYRNKMQNPFPPVNMPPPPPPPLPSPILPAFPQPPVFPNQPLSYQAFIPPPPQPWSDPLMGARVDYNARLLEGCNQTHGRRRNQRCNRSSATHSESASGSTQPSPQNPYIYQHVINFQHEAENQRICKLSRNKNKNIP